MCGMSSDVEFVQYVCEQIVGAGAVRYRKMFGDYMVYVNDRPVLLVCDNSVYVKMLPCICERMKGMPTGVPYPGAREHFLLDIDDAPFSREIAALAASVTEIPKPHRRRK